MGDGPLKERRAPTGLPAEVAPRVLELAQAFLGVEHAISFYPAGHQARRAPVVRFVAAMRALAGARGTAALGFAEDELSWEDELYGSLHPTVRKMVEALSSPGVARLAWTAEVDVQEVEAFMTRLARDGAGGRAVAWDPEEFGRLRVEGVDYRALMAEAPADTEAERRRDLWRALLARLAAEPGVELTEEERALLAGPWEDPVTLAACITEGIGPGAAAAEPAAVGALQRLAETVEGGPAAAEHEPILREAGLELPPALRLRLVEVAIDAGRDDLFARALGSPTPEELASLLARTFALDPAQISRLTRVFQHLVPRRLDRMELAGVVREQVLRGGAPEDAVPANVWEEVQELLTGEAGDFMSAGYRELLQRLASREERRRESEGGLADLADLETDLAPERTAEESLAIRAEQLHLATGEEAFREAATGLAEEAGRALAAGEDRRGLRALAALARAAGPDGEPAGPREVLLGTLAAATTPAALGTVLAGPEGLSRAAREVLEALAAPAPELVAGALLAALAAESDGERRHALVALVPGLPRPVRAELFRGLGECPAPAARALLGRLAEERDAEAVPGLVALLESRDRLLRRDAVRALARVDSAEARRVLGGLLDDEDDEVVRVAAVHLGSVGERGPAARLLPQLEGSGIFSGRRLPEVMRAVAALGWMRAPEAVEPLAGLLGRRSWTGRRVPEELAAEAAVALARIGGAEARQALEAAAPSAGGKLAATIRRLLSRTEAP